MEFPVLITDRTQQDVDNLVSLLASVNSWSNDVRNQFNLAQHKGAYNYTDLNRVSDAMDYLKDLLESYGYSVHGYSRVKIIGPGHVVTRPILPIEYTQLEYIESTGMQYIDTEYIPNPNTAMEAELLMSGAFKNVANYGGNSNLFNVVDGESQYGMNFGGGSNQGNEVFVWLNKINGTSGTEIQSFTITNTIRTNRNKLVVGKGSVSWGTASRSVTAKTTTQTTSLVLFGSKKDGVISTFTSYNMRVFSWQIKENGTLVRYFIPAKRISDNAIGLYDKVRNKFYVNAGTGAFTAGPENIEYEDVIVHDERYNWEESDIPLVDQMNQYLHNLSLLRGMLVMLSSTPSVPTSMSNLTYNTANDIEQILQDINTLLINMRDTWFYSGDIYSGEV